MSLFKDKGEAYVPNRGSVVTPQTEDLVKQGMAKIEFGKEYRDTQTGIKGVATSIHVYQYGCERITLEAINNDGDINEYTFDAPRLERVEDKKPVETLPRPGGPRDEPDRGSRGVRSVPRR